MWRVRPEELAVKVWPGMNSGETGNGLNGSHGKGYMSRVLSRGRFCPLMVSDDDSDIVGVAVFRIWTEKESNMFLSVVGKD